MTRQTAFYLSIGEMVVETRKIEFTKKSLATELVQLTVSYFIPGANDGIGQRWLRGQSPAPINFQLEAESDQLSSKLKSHARAYIAVLECRA